MDESNKETIKGYSVNIKDLQIGDKLKSNKGQRAIVDKVFKEFKNEDLTRQGDTIDKWSKMLLTCSKFSSGVLLRDIKGHKMLVTNKELRNWRLKAWQ